MSKNRFTAAMFDKIKETLEKSSPSGGTFANVMKFPANEKPYILRLVPNVDDLDKTFFSHYVHGWKSVATGQYTSTLSLQTFGEKDPITDTFWKLIKSEIPEEKELGKKIQRKEQWFVNVYVMEDPSNPENNGKVKVLKCGPQLKEIIDAALKGADSEEFGFRIFDLGENGANFKILAEEQGEFITYKKSKFANLPKLQLSDDEIEEVYASVHDLTAILPVKTYDELKDILNTHVFGLEEGEVKEERVSVPKKKEPTKSAKTEDVPVVDDGTDDPDDDIPFLNGKLKNSSTGDEEIDELLALID
jgi:hypothetical protein